MHVRTIKNCKTTDQFVDLFWIVGGPATQMISDVSVTKKSRWFVRFAFFYMLLLCVLPILCRFCRPRLGNGSWVAYLRDCYNLSTVTVGMVCIFNPDAALARLLTCQNKSTRLGFEMFLGLYRFNPSWQENRCPHFGSYCHPEDTSIINMG